MFPFDYGRYVMTVPAWNGRCRLAVPCRQRLSPMVYPDVLLPVALGIEDLQDLSLSQWLTHTPPKLVAEHLLIDKGVLATMPKAIVPIMPQ